MQHAVAARILQDKYIIIYMSACTKLGQATEEQLVRLKRESATTLSYAGVRKKAEWLGFIPKGAFLKTKWKKLEERLYGEPPYRRIQRRKLGKRGFPVISTT